MKYIISLTLICAAALAGCESANNEKRLTATPQPRGTLRLPEPTDQGAPLALTGGELATQFGGSLLFWADGVSKEQIAAISDASVEGRLAKAADMDYRFATLKLTDAKIATLEGEITAVDAAIQQAKLDNRDSDFARDLQKGLAARWFERRVEELQTAGVVDAAAGAAALGAFQGYCEFKLYELATSRLIQLDYAKRPTPLSMCEAYYASRQMFTGPSCEGGQGKYFACLWQEGVVKSQTFAALEAHNPTGADCAKSGQKRAAALRAWLASGTLERLVFDNDEKPIDRKTYAQLFEAAFLGGKALNMTKISLKKVDGQAVYPDVAACKSVVIRADLGALTWTEAELGDLKAIGESAAGQAQKYTIFAAFEGEAAETAEPKQAVIENLRLYAERNTGSLGDQADVLVSVDDAFFNRPIDLALVANAQNVANVKSDAAFAELFAIDDQLVPQELRDQLATLAENATALQAQRDLEAAEAAVRFQRISDANVAGINALGAPGALEMSRKLVLGLVTDGAVLSASFQVGGGTKYRGCVDLASGLPVACGDADPSDALLQGLAYDSGTGKVTLSGVLLDPEAAGFGFRARAPGDTDFNDRDASQYASRTLRLEIYANRIGERFQFLSGNAKLEAASGKVEREGSFSADAYRQ